MSEPIHPPPPLRILRELSGAIELPRLFVRLPWLAGLPRGAGEPVLVLPGYGTSDRSTSVLRGFVRLLGYRSHGWRLGRNTGNVRELLPRVIGRLVGLAGALGRPVHVIGWSLGGYFGRESARERPDLVEQVITMGSPVVGGPKYTVMAEAYRRRGVDLDSVESAVEARYERPITRPITAIYSRSDGIVAWKACIDRRSPHVEHVEVQTSHLGLGFSPEVYTIIAHRLAAPSAGRSQASG